MKGETIKKLADEGNLRADTSWFHVFRSMYESGQVKEMGSSAFTLYGAIKSHVDFSSGNAFPSFVRLQGLTGMAPATISKNLKILEKHGLLTAQREKGKATTYRLRESIPVMTSEGEIAKASWDYEPMAISKATKELKNFLATGVNDSQVIHIDQLNIQINLGENNTQNSTNISLSDEKPINEIIPEKAGIDQDLRATILRGVENSRKTREEKKSRARNGSK